MNTFKKTSYLVLSILIAFFISNRAMAATLTVVSDTQSVNIGDQFSVNIKVDTEGKSVNAAQSTVKFSKDILEVVNADKTGSVFNFWLDDPFVSNPSGTVSFTAGSTNGFSGKSLQVLKITFKVVGNGTADISLTSSAVTNSDGTGANILSKTYGVKIASGTALGNIPPVSSPAASEVPAVIVTAPTQITRPAIIASNRPAKPILEVPLFPDQTAWYSNSSNFLVTWKLPSDISAVSTQIDHNPIFSPVVSEGLFDSKTFKALDNGIWYLHVRFKNNIGWGSVMNYKISIDAIPPASFEIKVAEQNPTDVPNPTINYASGDQLSGIDHYSIRIDNGEIISTTESAYKLPLLPPGDHVIRVYAEDKAQNSTEGTLTLKILPVAAPAINFTSANVYVGEGNFYASGITPVGTTLLFSLKNSKDQVEYSAELKPDQNGAWTATVSDPLKRDDYYVEVLAKDARGALSFPVKSSTIKVRPRPVITILGVGITQFWFYLISLLILGGAYYAGFKTQKFRKEQRGRRTLITERDFTNLLEMIKNDLNSIEKQKGIKNLSPKETSEIDFSMNRIHENIKKMENYIMKNIEEINN